MILLHFMALIFLEFPKNKLFALILKPIIPQLYSATDHSVCICFTEVKKKVNIVSDAYLEANVARRIATDWENVGLYLEIDPNDLSTIKQLKNPVEYKCREMLRAWLERDQSDASRSPTWKNMYEAMRALTMIRAAEILQDELLAKYPDIN